MKKLTLVTLLVLLANLLYAQDIINWSPDYKLQISDFQSPSSQIGGVTVFSINTGSHMSFAYQMSNYEFMFTKNFNSKVDCIFNRRSAVLIAPDQQLAETLLKFAQYEFDLSELYARKFRQKLFEKKNAMSNINFAQPLFDEIQQEYSERHSQAVKLTDLGRDGEKLTELHADVLREMADLADFCKTCKPHKKPKANS